ncbi:diacylglycerol kinase family protein [bacterium]|nr:diacylglycerol kinase family protein [bacterium]
MTKFKSGSVKESISNAIHGLKLAFSSQRNFVIEVFISIIVIISAFLLRFSITDICILILMITIVLVCELINSVIEFTLDATYKNNYSRLVEMAKDMSAGMVLLVACMSILLGSLMFGKYIYKDISEYFQYKQIIHNIEHTPITTQSDNTLNIL